MLDLRGISGTEISRRVGIFKDFLAQNDMDGALLMQAADLFYFSGIFQNCFLFIPAEGEPLLMVRRSIDRVREVTPFENVVPVKNIKQVPSVLSEYGYGEIKNLGLEVDVLPASLYFNVQRQFPGVNLKDCSGIIKKIRAVKSEFELDLMKDTAAMMDRAFASIPDFLRSGATETELAGELEVRLRKEGHQGVIRVRGFNLQDYHYGCFLSGPSGGVPSFFDGPLGGPGMYPALPFGAGNKKVQENEPVIIDYVGAKHGYIIDMTRVFVLGKLDERLEKAHKVALEIQQDIMENAVPGAKCNDLYDRACNTAARYELQDYFMGGFEKVPFIAHGVGLELNELPVIARGMETTLEDGMVIALEPKFIFPGEGAVGIENTFAVRHDGLQKLLSFTDDIVQV